jgi:hypothetical protein
MSDAVTIAGVVVSGLVTPGIVAAYALHAQRQQHLQARRDELRTVLDYAAEQANAARRRVEFIHRAWKDGADPNTPEIQERINEWRDFLEGPRHAVDRLTIRIVGNDPTHIIAHYMDFLTALDHYRRVVERYADGEPYDPRAVTMARTTTLTERQRFLRAAFERVGLKPQEMSPLYPAMPLPDEDG